MLSRLMKWTIRLILVAALMLAVVVWYGQRYMQAPLSISQDALQYQLEPGGSLGTVVYGLARDEVLTMPRVLMAYSRLTGSGRHIHAGEYILEQGLTPLGLLHKLESGDVKQYQFSLIEGWTVSQLLVSLSQQKTIKATLDTAENDWYEAVLLNDDYHSMEGLLFPDTYQYIRGETDQQLLIRAHRRLLDVLDEEWQSRDLNLPYKTPYEALIMASLVEKETGVPHERAEIAGVFVRRLNKRMRLQTDPAVIYGLGPSFDGNLRSRHLKDSSNPFNTYRHNGLPPSPIAMVGREAIHAALHPKEGDTLYFVAKGDGSHYFSKTLDEHRQAVKQYQINQRRKDYRSAPPVTQ